MYIQNKAGFSKKDSSNPGKLAYTDMLGNEMTDGEEEELPEETYFQKNASKKYKTKKDHEKLKKITEQKGFCTWCYAKDHKKDGCPKQKKDLESKWSGVVQQ